MKNDLHYKKRDEFYTPKLLVRPIIQYIKKDWIVWCPFDTKDSEYVIELCNAGIKVIYSHIDEGKDFFAYEPKEYDCIISNIPFSKKIQILTRLYALGKPFAILLNLPILNYQNIGEFFLDKDLQLLIFDKKVSFNGNTASFNTSYFCNNMLPKDLMFHHLEHNNSNKHYEPAKMYKLN